MKKIIGILLVAVMVITGGAVSVFADVTGGEIHEITISNFCTFLWAGESPQPTVVIDPELKEKINIEEEWFGLGDLAGTKLIVGGDNIALENGTYSYQLTLSAEEGFSFSNDLEVYYQGVDGRYKMDYTFPPGEDANHTMIVMGDFNNIIAASPLKIDVGKLLAYIISGDYSKAIDFILDEGLNFSDNVTVDDVYPVSDDKYSYEIVLKTKEGFHFSNKLDFIYDGEKYGYTIDYDYDLLENNHTLKIKVGDKKKTEPSKPESDTADLSPGASGIAADKAITNMTSDSDPTGTVFSELRFRSTYQSSNSIRLKWKKLSNARAYIIYGNKCGGSNKPIRLAPSIGNTLTIKSIDGMPLKKGTYYKFIIVALDGKGNVVSSSKVIHVATKGRNHKSVSVSKAAIAKAKKLRKGKALKLHARAVAQSKKYKVKKHVALRYETTNNNIATVSNSGKIIARAKGTCYIYALAQDGAFKKIKVKVK